MIALWACSIAMLVFICIDIALEILAAHCECLHCDGWLEMCSTRSDMGCRCDAKAPF